MIHSEQSRQEREQFVVLAAGTRVNIDDGILRNVVQNGIRSVPRVNFAPKSHLPRRRVPGKNRQEAGFTQPESKARRSLSRPA